MAESDKTELIKPSQTMSPIDLPIAKGVLAVLTIRNIGAFMATATGILTTSGIIHNVTWLRICGAVATLLASYGFLGRSSASKLGLILAGLMGMSIFHGCAWVKATVKATPQLINCAADALLDETKNLIPTVTAILSGNAADWAGQLDALGKVGEHALACAVKAVTDAYATDNPPASQPATSKATPVSRGQTYIDQKGWQFQ